MNRTTENTNENPENASSFRTSIESLTTLEIETVGELKNISVSAAATAASEMLDRNFSILSSEIVYTPGERLALDVFEPAVVIEIKVTGAIEGRNFTVMKRSDIRDVLGSVLGEEEGLEDAPFDDTQLGTFGDIMNRIFAAQGNALSGLLGTYVDYTVDAVTETDNIYETIEQSGDTGDFVAVRYSGQAEGQPESEFVSLIPVSFVKELVKMALDTHSTAASGNTNQTETVQKTPEKTPMTRSAEVNVKPLVLSNFDEAPPASAGNVPSASMNLIMDVPLGITVEIGRSIKQVKEILELRQGSIIELDKQAGDPVDIIVNGHLIARGDVVVIDESFGVRITEIIDKGSINEKLI